MNVLYFTQKDAEILLKADRPPEPSCKECGDTCHPDDSRVNWEQWQESKLCRECNDEIFEEYENELRRLPR